MAQIIKQLDKMLLETDDIVDYIVQYERSQLEQIELIDREIAKMTKRAKIAEAKIKEIRKAEKVKQAEQAEKVKQAEKVGKVEQEKAEQLSRIVAAFLALGKDIHYISDVMDVPEIEIDALIKKNDLKNK